MTTSSKRPEHVAWASMILSAVFFAVAFLLGRWSGFFAVSAVSWLSLSSVLIWFVLAIQFHQRALAEQEKLDVGQLAKDERTAAIFQAKGERDALFAAARGRLAILEKWFIPIFSAVVAVYQVAIGLRIGAHLYSLFVQAWRIDKAASLLSLLETIPAGPEVDLKQPLLCAVCMTATVFVSFLMSRYATGMSAEPQWKPLRAGGSFLLGIAILCFALAIGLALAQHQIFIVLNIAAWVISILLILVGIETAVNIVLDIYRPRLKDQYGRAAFDSRLLGIINEPGGVFRSAAGAIDYQFGFKVSQTWFYKLLEKAITPLILFAAATIYFLSCILVVAPNEQAIIERLGNPINAAGEVRLVGPGLTFKWPWPIDKARTFATQQISELYIGYVPHTEKDPNTGKDVIVRETQLLWGSEHYDQEHSFLVATEYTGRELPEGAVPVSLINANIPVQYTIDDLHSYVYNYHDPVTVLEAICYRELTKFAAGATIDVDNLGRDAANLQQSLFGAGRDNAKELLKNNIQNAADSAGLGVKIVFLGLQGIHPPMEVATDYQDVVGAVQHRQKLILDAQTQRNKNLSSLAGSLKGANELYGLAKQYQQAKSQNSPNLSDLAARLDEAFAQAGGDISIELREAQTYAFEKVTLAKATGMRFADQLKAYRAAKDIYKRRHRLRALEDALKDLRKYVVVFDPNDKIIFTFDFKQEQIPSLYDITGIGEENSEQ